MTVHIERVGQLSRVLLNELTEESERLGFRFVHRLIAEWDSGANRFDLPGEALFVATIAGRVVGVCGLNIDPYAGDLRVGRVRHLYVLAAQRRKGAGRQLVTAVIKAASACLERLRLRTNTLEAARFYEMLGFQSCAGEADCTHVLELGALSRR